MRSIFTPIALAPLAVLAGCAGDAPPAPRPVTVSRRPAPPPSSLPTIQIVGSEARVLIGQLGTPALDQHEGPARKLQFRGAACVLDAYLYPPPGGGVPRVTWIDTRNPQGNDMDHATCIAALGRH